MQNSGINASMTTDGFLLLDASMKPVYINRAAMEILCYPQRPEAYKRLDAFLSTRIAMTLFSARASQTPVLVSEFLSGRRRYLCRAYRLDGPVNGKTQGSVAVLLERASAGAFSLGLVSEKFRLTSREQEVLRHLLLGRTTKEIATGMEISPHTVKAFLRMIMVKMGVSTRSAILGKAFTARDGQGLMRQ
jgi:DNA-binding CsgD family transcriptional regulator